MKTRPLGHVTTGRPDRAEGPLRPGSRLGRYELILPIGHGGMASVWAARLTGEAGFSKLVAIKTTLPHLANVTEIRRMLLDEARIAARLHHPNVVTIHELGDEDGVAYVVMEWLNCASLDRLLGARSDTPEGTPDPRLAARIVADACAGLHSAHELVDDEGHPLCVVHRDVSPHNLLISADGAVKVADFGIVKARGQIHRTAAGGDPRGRLSYMAPERVTGQAIDRRADVFALGCTLHEALTGELVFDGENEAQVVLAISEARYTPRPAHVEKAPGLFAIVARAVARAPGDRYATAEEMRHALEEWLEQNAPPIATAADIAGFVRDRVGPELEKRQARLREALSAVRHTAPKPVAAETRETMALAFSETSTAAPSTGKVGLESLSPAPVYHWLPRAAEGRSPAWRATASFAVAAAAVLMGLGARAALNGTPRDSRETHRDAPVTDPPITPSAAFLPAREPLSGLEPAPGDKNEPTTTARTADASVRLPPARLDKPIIVPPARTRPPGVAPSDEIPRNPY